MPDTPLRALGWIAVSSQIQANQDKISLLEQDRLIREYCQLRGWRLIDMLSVPGHSRSESDVIDALDELAEQGCFAYHNLRTHWKKKDFDVLIVFDSSRLARSQSLYAFVVENVVRSGAAIHLIQGGVIDDNNLEFGIALGGVSATAGIRRLVKMTAAANLQRVSKGLQAKHAPFSHRVIYDETSGQPVRLELKEELARFFEDVARLFLAGEGYQQFPKKMAALGHINPKTGKAYSTSVFFRVLHSPYTWGHTAINFDFHYGAWAYDESAELPAGAEVFRNTILPVYSGKLAEDMIAELKRRSNSIKGKASPDRTYKFTGLMRCGHCNYSMVVTWQKTSPRRKLLCWQCTIIKQAARALVICTNTRRLRDDKAQFQINRFFERMRDQGLYDAAEMVATAPHHDLQSQIERITKEINSLDKRIDTMILRQSTAPLAVADRYAGQIETASKQLETLKLSRQKLQAEFMKVSDPVRAQTFRDMLDMGLENFWQQDSRVINQTLHKAIGQHRFIVLNGEIVDFQ